MEKVITKDNERIDDLQIKGLKIIQNTEGFCFGMDAVLLANYADIKKDSVVVDLGTGTGIIPLLIYAKNQVKKIYGIEIQDEVSEMAKRTMVMNNVENSIEILNMDLKKATEELGTNKVDVVTSNPPYMEFGGGLINPRDKKAISRHEIMCTLKDVITTASKLLKHNGRFFMVHRPHRLADIMCLLREYKLEPKSIRFVHPKASQKPNMVLIKSIKAARPELKFENPLYVYDEKNNYTDEIYKIYGMERGKDSEG